MALAGAAATNRVLSGAGSVPGNEQVESRPMTPPRDGPCVVLCLSRMMRKYHVRFLGGGRPATASCYPASVLKHGSKQVRSTPLLPLPKWTKRTVLALGIILTFFVWAAHVALGHHHRLDAVLFEERLNFALHFRVRRDIRGNPAPMIGSAVACLMTPAAIFVVLLSSGP